MYRELATFYDNSLRDRFSQLMVHHVCSALDELVLTPPARVLDLGCGTGLLALGLTERGYQVTGLDQSERMLDIARRRIERDEVDIELLQGDMRAFEVDQRFDATVATGDMINHLLEDADLADCLGCVFDATAPGGAFVFDVSNEIIYKSPLWNCVDSVGEGDNYTITCNARYNPRARIGRLAMHVVEETPMTKKDLRGSIRQRFWTDDELARHLADAGFDVESARTFHPFDAPQQYPWLEGGKTLWVCTRR